MNKYGYSTGKYWVYSSGGSASSGYKASSTARDRKYSYNYKDQWECHGFACFVMSKVTGTEVIPRDGNKNGWKKYTSVSSLKVGDIVRSNSGHSAIVLSINSNGVCTFAEAWGSKNCKINIGKFNDSVDTYSGIKNKYGINYIYRFEG